MSPAPAASSAPSILGSPSVATERDAYGYAADAFEPVLARLRTVATEGLPKIEGALEAAGAGDTPGRLPEWKRR